MYGLINIILSVFLVSGLIQSQSLNFKKENIEITIDRDYSYVKGDYYFESTGFNQSEFQIYYPFVVNELLDFPDSISVYNASLSKNIPFKKLANGISFHLSPEPYSLNKIEIYYRQKIRGNYFEYILTTTEQWKKPLEKSEFIINLPCSYTDVEISFKEDSSKTVKDFKQYSITKKNFMPDHNLIIKWRLE